jgi:hypothetical protein
MTNWKVMDNPANLRVGDVVQVWNGYEMLHMELDESDLRRGSVSNGMHNEQARLGGENCHVYSRTQGDLFA